MKRVAVFLLFGQSNATGHGIPMEEKDYIIEPLKNVYGLNRNPNQSFDIEKLTFSGYTSYGMNLAEEQDNTYSVANCLARRWQDDIDNGVDLPDLYIVQIAIGSQGVFGMWNPDREKKLIPGALGTVDISLYPFTIHILSLLKKYFEQNEIDPDFVGIHWRGGEQEFWQSKESLEPRLKPTYLRILNGMREALGYDAPIVLHKMPFDAFLKNEKDNGKSLNTMYYINSVFEELASELPNTTVFDPKRAPHYNEQDPYSFFRWDLIHFNPDTNRWVAREILEEYKRR